MNREFVEVDIDEVTVKERVRDRNGDLKTLESSISKVGLLCPIIVGRGNVLISGGRRLEACRHVGMKKVPAVRLDIDADSMEAFNIQVDENLCRAPLSGEEFEKFIQRKKQRMSGSGTRHGVLDRLKKVFAR